MKYDITPIGKPRMTRADRWKRRPAVMRYWAFKDECRLRRVVLPAGSFHLHFILPMPESWSKKKRDAMRGTLHAAKPDTDNMVKAITDALMIEDAHLADYRASKWWGDSGAIVVVEIPQALFPVNFCQK